MRGLLRRAALASGSFSLRLRACAVVALWRLCGAFYWLVMVVYHHAQKPLKTHCRGLQSIGIKIARNAAMHYGQSKAPAIISPGRLWFIYFIIGLKNALRHPAMPKIIIKIVNMRSSLPPLAGRGGVLGPDCSGSLCD